jgi:alpha-galactosidase
VRRRELFKIAVAAPLAAIAQGTSADPLTRAALAKSRWRVLTSDGRPAPTIHVERTWSADICHSRVINRGATAVRVREIVLFDVPHNLPPDTPFYGEGMQMLTQTGGTIGRPVDLGNYTDPKHYKLPEPAGAKTVYGLAVLGRHVLAFGSCRRFNGKFHVRPTTIEVALDVDDLELAPGKAWDLEEVALFSGPDREALLERVADRLNANHPPLLASPKRLRGGGPPSGWCSWYCFGPNVTATQVLDNLDVIARDTPGLKYIQIDDGYQPAMGDWLETGKAFGGNVQDVLQQIRTRGFEPAIWVAPFIAEKESHLFQQHPDWFVRDASGAPLASNTVTFGGWRHGPWYVVDGTHPEAQKHLEHVFRTMRQAWDCTYFKLDANFWGAIHGGRFRDHTATRIEAYRRGMQAVLRGAGDAFILGCNHPIWASTGVIHGSRSSNDIKRTWDRIATTGRQNLYRNWQNGRLWWNDPDAVVLTGDLPDNEFRFHASVIYATGGMVLSGDDLTRISPERMAMLRKLQPPTGAAARFDDESLRAGIVDRGRERVACLFNWEETPQTITVAVPGPCRMRDFWSGEESGRHAGGRLSMNLPPRTARLLVCSDAQ